MTMQSKFLTYASHAGLWMLALLVAGCVATRATGGGATVPAGSTDARDFEVEVRHVQRIISGAALGTYYRGAPVGRESEHRRTRDARMKLDEARAKLPGLADPALRARFAASLDDCEQRLDSRIRAWALIQKLPRGNETRPMEEYRALLAEIDALQPTLHEVFRDAFAHRRQKLEQKLRAVGAEAERQKSIASSGNLELRTDVPLPAPGSPVRERQLRRYFRWPSDSPSQDQIAAQAFAQAPRELFVFFRESSVPDTAGVRAARVGEAMLVESVGGDGMVHLIAVDGTRYLSEESRVGLAPLASGPPLAFRAADLHLDARAADANRIVDRPEFLNYMTDGSPDKVAFEKDMKRTVDCFHAAFARLDPDRKAHDHDIVTYSGGKVKKIESMYKRVERKAYRACKVAGFLQRRAKLEARVFSEERARRFAALKPRYDRVNALFP